MALLLRKCVEGVSDTVMGVDREVVAEKDLLYGELGF